MVPQDRLQQIKERFGYVEARMSEGSGDIAALGREYADLRPVVAVIEDWEQVQAEIAEGLGDSDKGGAPHEDKGRKDSSRLGDEGDCACPPMRTVVPVSRVRFARFNSSALHHRDATA